MTRESTGSCNLKLEEQYINNANEANFFLTGSEPAKL